MFGIRGVYICVMGIQKNILWMGWVIARNELRRLQQESTVLTIWPQLGCYRGAQRDLILKIILLFFVCMYSVDFIPTLDGAIPPALIIDPRSFFSVYGGGGRIFHGILLACSLQIYVLCASYVMIICVCSHIFIPSQAGQCSRWPWMGLRSFFPVCGG